MATTTKARPKAAARKTPAARAVTTRKAIARKVPKSSSGVITVKVATLPGVAKDIALERGKATLQEALRLFGVHRPSDVRVNNKPVAATSDMQLAEGAFVTVVGRVNGGL